MIWHILYLILGFVMLVKGADFFVEGASGLAARLRIPDLIIGLTIVAMGTSAPEAAVSIAAGFSGNADITIGNIVGSNIFNILFVVGTTSLLVAVPFDAKFIIDSLFMIASAVILLIAVLPKQRLGKIAGAVMLVCYGVYFGYLCLH